MNTKSMASPPGQGGLVDASTVDRWAAEWVASAALREQFPTVGAYVATKKREARIAGAIVEPSARKPAVATATGVEQWAEAWNASADLQAEYPTVEAYIATMRRK